MWAKPFAIAVLVLPLVMQWLPAGAVEAKYFSVRTGDHPHDVAPAPDGTVWYTGQRTGVLGRRAASNVSRWGKARRRTA
jgi:virginiamycin B lyase